MSDAMRERAIGLGLLLLGLGLCYAFLYLPYAAMLADADEVDFGFKRALLGPLCALLGLAYIALGERAKLLRTTERNWKVMAFAFLAVGVASLPYLWLNAQFTAHGYS